MEVFQTDFMSTAELAALPPAEKWKMLEFLWESLRPELDSLPVPAEHKKLLDERRSQAQAGKSKPVSWEQAKRKLAGS
ncbi:acyl-protein synthetase [bacterium]|nr:acyl-protein synthetase [bacterium]